MNGLLGDAARGLVRGVTADFAGAPVDTLNAIRSGLLGPTQAGNPYAAALGGLLGPVQQVGSGDWIAQQMGLPQGSGMVYETARMLAPSPTEILNLARRVPLQELITYHGTPHTFESTPDNPLGEFRASQIGTGEGAQAYGHGIYVAESPGVATDYRNKLSYNLIAREFLNKLPEDASTDEVLEVADSLSPVQRSLIKALAEEDWLGFDYPSQAINSVLTDPVSNFDVSPKLKNAIKEATGSLYTADLPDEMIDRMLDWDKPLSEQSLDVQKKIQQVIDQEFGKGTWSAWAKSNPDYRDLRDSLFENKTEPEISELFRQAGIPGIKYLDAGSRGDKAKPTRNFVIFPGEEKKVKILKRE